MLIGLVGKTNTGKSTFFKAATLANVEISDRPFVTIKANEGIGFVKVKCPEQEFKVKCKPKHGYCVNGWRFIPVKLLDVAGLVPGAHQGKGLGNKFLDDLRQADCFIHIVDTSGTTDEEGKKTKGYNPIKDITFLKHEIEMWLASIVGENWQQFTRKVKVEGKKLTEELARKLSGLKINEEQVKKAIRNLNLSENSSEWSQDDLMNFVREIMKLSKPMIIAANKIDLDSAQANLKILKENFDLIIPCSADNELALREAAKKNLIEYIPGDNDFKIKGNLNEQQKKALEFIKNVLKQYETGTGVQECLNKAVFDLLNYIVVYPVENEKHLTDKDGNVLPDAILLPNGSNALDLAAAVHTDLVKRFVAAIDARTSKRLGKEYKLRNNDIIRIMTH